MRIHGKHRNGHGWFAGADFLFEPRDVWIGLYWKRYPKAMEMYWCILPCVPLRVYIQWDM